MKRFRIGFALAALVPVVVLPASAVAFGADEGGLPPAAPHGLKASVENGRSLKLTWTAVAGATSYNVYGSSKPGVTRKNGYRTPSSTNSLVSGANPGDIFHIVVTAVNAYGESPESAEVTIKVSGRKAIATHDQGMNQAQIDAMERMRQLRWNATTPDMGYR